VDKDDVSMAKSIVTTLTSHASDFDTPMGREVLLALEASHATTGDQPCSLYRFVALLNTSVQASIDLGKRRGEGSLSTGSKEWRHRLVQAHMQFLQQVVPRSQRLELWYGCTGRRCGLRERPGDAAMEERDAVLSYVVAAACIPMSIQAALSAAYPDIIPTPGEAEVKAAVEADDFSRLDGIALKNIRYHAGKQERETPAY
jgi:hypothetical protein